MTASSVRETSALERPGGRALVRLIRRRPLASFFPVGLHRRQVLPWTVTLAGRADRVETYDSPLDMTELSATYGVEPTGLGDWVHSIVALGDPSVATLA